MCTAKPFGVKRTCRNFSLLRLGIENTRSAEAIEIPWKINRPTRYSQEKSQYNTEALR